MIARDTDASVQATIARLQAAMADVANGDITAIKALYSHADDATSFYGWGGYEKAWDAVAKRVYLSGERPWRARSLLPIWHGRGCTVQDFDRR